MSAPRPRSREPRPGPAKFQRRRNAAWRAQYGRDAITIAARDGELFQMSCINPAPYAAMAHCREAVGMETFHTVYAEVAVLSYGTLHPPSPNPFPQGRGHRLNEGACFQLLSVLIVEMPGRSAPMPEKPME